MVGSSRRCSCSCTCTHRPFSSSSSPFPFLSFPFCLRSFLPALASLRPRPVGWLASCLFLSCLALSCPGRRVARCTVTDHGGGSKPASLPWRMSVRPSVRPSWMEGCMEGRKDAWLDQPSTHGTPASSLDRHSTQPLAACLRSRSLACSPHPSFRNLLSAAITPSLTASESASSSLMLPRSFFLFAGGGRPASSSSSASASA